MENNNSYPLVIRILIIYPLFAVYMCYKIVWAIGQLLLLSLKGIGVFLGIYSDERERCFTASLSSNGRLSDIKKCFPEGWSREKVTQSIHEAYDHYLTSGTKARRRNDKLYLVYGKCKNGVLIEMLLTENGTIKTAHPVFE